MCQTETLNREDLNLYKNLLSALIISLTICSTEMNPGISGTKWLHSSRYSGGLKGGLKKKKKGKEFSILHSKKSVKNIP